jgi:prepilin-type N-terminal cleavage/methylation domain-containing protein
MSCKSTGYVRRVADGFSLIESAVVLAVIGVILGGVWVLADQAWEYAKRESAKEAIATTVANVRNYYAGQAGVANKGSAALTNDLLTANAIPISLSRGAAALCGGNLCADTPWGSASNGATDANGTFRVCNWSLVSANCPAAPGISAFFAVILKGLTRKSCVALTEAVSGSTGPTGLVNVNINGFDMLALQKPFQPVAPSDATTYCESAVDGNATANFVYRVVAPSP